MEAAPKISALKLDGVWTIFTQATVIHCDVKPSNILVDENFVTKVLDFGLVKPEDRIRLHGHVSTKVKGTFGYLDPYYLSTQKLTKKSDTCIWCSFLGSIMLEYERILNKSGDL